VCVKNISDGVGRRNKSIDTPLYPPLFWLDNIFMWANATLKTRKSKKKRLPCGFRQLKEKEIFADIYFIFFQLQ
jgi:hypothetical protein